MNCVITVTRSLSYHAHTHDEKTFRKINSDTDDTDAHSWMLTLTSYQTIRFLSLWRISVFFFLSALFSVSVTPLWQI